MDFGSYGKEVNNRSVDYNTAMLRFSKNLGISKTMLLNNIEQLLKVTEDYDKRIKSLTTLPDDNKKTWSKFTGRYGKNLTAFNAWSMSGHV